jgi:prepilin-type N-terminal cleavage/methylation domain-containing protein
MRQRKGFTLIELMVALAILLVLTFMALSSFSIILAASKSNQNRETVVEDMSTVLDQLTKELRQTVTSTASTSFKGVDLPVYSSSVDAVRGLTSAILPTPSPQPGSVGQGQSYSFGDPSDTPATDTRTILRFYSQGDDGGVYRISYTLGLPLSNGGISRTYWANQFFQPCEVWYTRQKWSDANANGLMESSELANVVFNQPVTGQVITNFTVIRPAWSDNVIQIVLEAMVKNTSGGGSTKITRIAQISLRQ